MPEETKIYHMDSKYRVVFERSAVKGIDGFKVEANGDDLNDTQLQAQALYEWAMATAKVTIAEGK